MAETVPATRRTAAHDCKRLGAAVGCPAGVPRRFEIRTTARTFEITAESAEHARDMVDRPRGPVRRAACPGAGGGTLPVRGGVRAGRLVLKMLAGPLPGIYDPTGPGRILFGFFAAMAETERENVREATFEGLDAAAAKATTADAPRSSPTTCCTPCSAAGPPESPSRPSEPT